MTDLRDNKAQLRAEPYYLKEYMSKYTSIELSRSAFLYNCEQIKKAARASQVAIVIKGNAYGHGITEIAAMAQETSAIDWLCTAGIAEALHIRKQGIQKPLLVLSHLDDDIEKAIHEGIHLTLYNLEDAYAINNAAERAGKKAYIHIKVDTGMSHLGILPEEALAFIRSVKLLPHLIIYGLYTHLCDTPNPDPSFSYLQLKTFDTVIDLIEAAGIKIECTHAQSSSALCLQPTRPYSFIRTGAAAYGIWKSEEHKNRIQARHPTFNIMPVMQWKTQIIHLKHIPQGATVGYDRTYKATRPMQLALAPIGYQDGYLRTLSNNGIALINNYYAPVVGMITMNMTAFDVTNIPHIQLHDEILLLGDVPHLTAAECARSGRIITNEMVAHINASIERTVVHAHQPIVVQDSQKGLVHPRAPF